MDYDSLNFYVEVGEKQGELIWELRCMIQERVAIKMESMTETIFLSLSFKLMMMLNGEISLEA